MKFIGEPIRSTILIATKENRTRPLISLSSPNTKFGVLSLDCEQEALDFLSFLKHGDSIGLGQLHPKHSQRREMKRGDGELYPIFLKESEEIALGNLCFMITISLFKEEQDSFWMCGLRSWNMT